DFDTKEAQTRLFAGPTKVVSIEPATFMASLEAKYAEATKVWRRLLDAVAASMRTAKMDFPTTDLEAMRASLAAVRLPEAWVAAHPLLADAEGEWARLDELRRADPVAYLD